MVEVPGSDEAGRLALLAAKTRVCVLSTGITGPVAGGDARQLVSTVACAVLGLPGPPAGFLDQDLYELGFDSLSLFRLRARIVQLTHVAIGVEELFDAATLSHIADLLSKSCQEPSHVRAVALARPRAPEGGERA
jgi:aryl carrier-like protein